jgi:hypothetical protein
MKTTKAFAATGSKRPNLVLLWPRGPRAHISHDPTPQYYSYLHV